MQTIPASGKVDQNGRLHVEADTNLPQGDVEVMLLIEPKYGGHPCRRYDFSDIVGKLQWRGDAVKTQRALRDEWSD